MVRVMSRCVLLFAFLPFVLFQTACAQEAMKDGRYISEAPMLKVAVTIKDGVISEIEILEHKGGKGYDKMVEPLIEKILMCQSTDIDAVTGATMSSEALKKAVDDALRRAREN